MDNCTRHAFTDGQCVTYGCKDCPATIWIPPTETEFGRHLLKVSRQRLLFVLAIPFAIFCLGYAGAAFTAQGSDNIKNWTVQHKPV